jgi:hypothetical protein
MGTLDNEYMKTVSEMEQSGEFLIQNLPPLWWGLYHNCMERGFTSDQAFELVKQYIQVTFNSIKNTGGDNVR